MATRVLVWSRIPGLLDHLKREVASAAPKIAPTIAWKTGTPDDYTESELAEAHVMVADPPLVAPFVKHAASMTWMQSTFAGVDALITNSTKRDYVCTRNSAPSFGPLIAEYVIGWCINVERQFPALMQLQKKNVWDHELGTAHRPLFGQQMSVLGAGTIGCEVMRVARAMGMRTVAMRSSVRPTSHAQRVVDNVPAALDGADFVVSILPSTPGTRGLLSGDALKSANGAVFINVGRGDLIDEASILRALDEGWISAAVLDVVPTEPLPESSPLWSHPRVHITPHVAAISLPEDVAKLFARNLCLWAGQADPSDPAPASTTSGAHDGVGAGASTGTGTAAETKSGDQGASAGAGAGAAGAGRGTGPSRSSAGSGCGHRGASAAGAADGAVDRSPAALMRTLVHAVNWEAGY